MRPGFICIHVARGGHPVCFVEHDSPVDEVDSGWVLGCSYIRHEDAELMVVDVDRYIDQDPALQELRKTLQEGSMAQRSRVGGAWAIEPIPPDPEDPAEAA